MDKNSYLLIGWKKLFIVVFSKLYVRYIIFIVLARTNYHFFFLLPVVGLIFLADLALVVLSRCLITYYLFIFYGSSMYTLGLYSLAIILCSSSLSLSTTLKFSMTLWDISYLKSSIVGGIWSKSSWRILSCLKRGLSSPHAIANRP